MIWCWGPWSRARHAEALRPREPERPRPIDWQRERWVTYTLADGSLSLEYPARWSFTPLFDQRTEVPLDDLKVRVMCMGQFQPPRATLYVTRYECHPGLAPREWLRRVEHQPALRSRLVGELLERRETEVSNTHAVWLRTRSVPPNDGQFWEKRLLFFGDGEIAYEVAVTAPQSAIDPLVPGFERILASVQFRPPGRE